MLNVGNTVVGNTNDCSKNTEKTFVCDNKTKGITLKVHRNYSNKK